MGIIRKENAEDITPFSFAQGMGEAPPDQEWRVSSGAQGLDDRSADPAAQQVGMPGQQVHALGEEPSVSAAGVAPEAIAEPASQGEPPVFEISEDILGAFYEQAVMAGIEEGKGQVLAELGILQERFTGALEQLAGVSRELAAQNQVQLITMACRIAEKLVRDELSVRPERLMGLISSALKEHEGADEILVRCSPPDFEYISERQSDLVAGSGSSFKVRVEASPELEYGDFQIETARGNVDGRISSRVEEIEQTLKEPGTDV